ncbi:MAG: hypothetical protein DHS80DRAFT_29013 [Piptocephalis tieghemiana]|nr:MAG: hypothetical protein DHS80DRAFT_29013 [Piptocephalis tieghemiana]
MITYTSLLPALLVILSVLTSGGLTQALAHNYTRVEDGYMYGGVYYPYYSGPLVSTAEGEPLKSEPSCGSGCYLTITVSCVVGVLLLVCLAFVICGLRRRRRQQRCLHEDQLPPPTTELTMDHHHHSTHPSSSSNTTLITSDRGKHLDQESHTSSSPSSSPSSSSLPLPPPPPYALNHPSTLSMGGGGGVGVPVQSPSGPVLHPI